MHLQCLIGVALRPTSRAAKCRAWSRRFLCAAVVLVLFLSMSSCAGFETRDKRFYYRALWNFALRDHLLRSQELRQHFLTHEHHKTRHFRSICCSSY
jgi:hypothetical protein